MRNLLIALSLVLLPSLASCQDKIDRYISHFADIAISEMHRSGIPASITIAQGMFESNYGESPSATTYNNHFGIKCKKEWAGPYFYKHDDDRDENGKLIPSCFRAYATVLESYQDHTNFLIERDRYAELFTFHHTDYRSWALGLERCGYATNKMYAERLIEIIERYSLNQYDHVQQIATTPVPKPQVDQQVVETSHEVVTEMTKPIESVEETGVILETYDEADLFKVVEIPAAPTPAEVKSNVVVASTDTIPTTKIIVEKVEPATNRVNQAIILPANYKRSSSTTKVATSKMK